MAHSDSEQGSTAPPRRKTTWALLGAAAALLLIAWLIAQFPPIPEASSIDRISPVYNLMAAGALPWFIQWAGVVCVILAFCRGRDSRRVASFAILGSFVLAAVWWSGLAFRFRGMDVLDMVLDAAMFEIQSQFWSNTAFDEILFNFIGPMLGPFQLHGPLSLRGWDFIITLFSTTTVVGYLLIVGRVCHFERRSCSASECLKVLAAMLPCFLPPFIRLGIRIAMIK
jgi:hypothetical protein